MSLFKHEVEGTHRADVLDIRALRCNVKIERTGRNNKVAVRILQGTRAEKATLKARKEGGRLTLTGGGPSSPQRIVHMATGGPEARTRQVLRNVTIEGGMVIGNAGNINFSPRSGDARVGSARNVNFGPELTVQLVVGGGVRIIES